VPVTFYRIVHTDPPPLADLTSPAAIGKAPPDDDPETLRLWDGISVYDTVLRAMAKSRRYPWLGTFIAKLEIPNDGSFRIERTTKSRGHYTIWAEPEDLLESVTEMIHAG
jgi:hypothetical protein